MAGTHAGPGATPGQWDHFARVLGLESDLLPVVMAFDAKISERSKLKDLGKTPSVFNRAGEAVGIPEWTSHIATDRDVGRWARDPRLGMCVIGRQVKAIDIDIPDPDAAAQVEAMVRLALGDLPTRRREGTGKCLMMVACPGPLPKRVIRTRWGAIELLGDRQQWVCLGTHASGARIAWDDGTPEVPGVPAHVPPVDLASLLACWDGLAAVFGEGKSIVERTGIVPARPRAIADTKDPAVAYLDENGWVTSHERDGRVFVRCPWESGHSMDSGPSATVYFPAGVGGFEQGHFRCLHASCAGRTDGGFLGAVGYQAHGFEVIDPTDALAIGQAADGTPRAPLPPYERNRRGAPLATLTNVLRALRRPDECGCRIAWDDFLTAIMIVDGADGGEWRPFKDSDYTALRETLALKGFEPIGGECIRDAVHKVAEEGRFDSASTWARGLVWDGTPRVETFFPAYLGTVDSPYTRAVGLYTWTALAGRALMPDPADGLKADMTPALIGMQGASKTSAIEAMAPHPRMFTEVDLHKKDDDLSRAMRGKLVGELAELKGLQSRDAESIKAWLSRRVERWTPKYKEFETVFPRRMVCFGTGNREEFLDDDTGERRWLPVSTDARALDVPGIRAVREQLWAEGVALFSANGVMWQDAQRLAVTEHAAFKVDDSWRDRVVDWLGREDMDGPRSRRQLRMCDVLQGAVGIGADKADRKHELRMGKILRELGYRKRVLDGARCWVLFAGNSASDLA